jgi:glycosyltransferase involved in cell wall biosynthesis
MSDGQKRFNGSWRLAVFVGWYPRAMRDVVQTSRKKYTFGFILSTSLGNLTRYQNFRKFAERDMEIEFVWAPVKHYIGPGEHDPFRRWPRALRARAIVLYQSAPVLLGFSRFDAVMIHMYEVDILTAIRGYFFRRPRRIISTDDAPVVDPSTYPVHPADLAKPRWKKEIRLRIDLWRASKADALIPFSSWAANILVQGAGVPPAKVTPVHVGLDLETWRYHERESGPSDKPVKLLFVGGDFVRKGGSLLLDVFTRHFIDIAELHLVTKTAPTELPRNVHVYNDMDPNDERLRALYREADVFVLPTTADLSSWVALEAMASGCATIVTPVGGIVDIVEDGVSGLFVGPGDAAALTLAIATLVGDRTMRIAMGKRGRQIIERDFDAEVNVPKILAVMKSMANVN